MLVIKAKGTTSTVTGWRAWLLYALLCIGVVVVLAAVAMLLIGLTVTIGIILLLAVPLAIVGAVLAELLRPMRGR